MYKCQASAGIVSDTTAVNHGQYVRDVMSQRIAQDMKTVQLVGIIEIDESQVGHAHKNDRGHHAGKPIWIFGITERDTKR